MDWLSKLELKLVTFFLCWFILPVSSCYSATITTTTTNTTGLLCSSWRKEGKAGGKEDEGSNHNR